MDKWITSSGVVNNKIEEVEEEPIEVLEEEEVEDDEDEGAT